MTTCHFNSRYVTLHHSYSASIAFSCLSFFVVLVFGVFGWLVGWFSLVFFSLRTSNSMLGKNCKDFLSLRSSAGRKKKKRAKEKSTQTENFSASSYSLKANLCVHPLGFWNNIVRRDVPIHNLLMGWTFITLEKGLGKIVVYPAFVISIHTGSFQYILVWGIQTTTRGTMEQPWAWRHSCVVTEGESGRKDRTKCCLYWWPPR